MRARTSSSARFGHVLDYMARVELEVDRNVLELTTMLPDPPEIDRHFYADVWQPQEIQHGLILDRLQVELGRESADADLESIGLKLRVLGALAHLAPFQDVCRMLYYLTGMATERSAVLAYNLLHRGTLDLGEQARSPQTVIGQIKRQEPGHFVFYQLSARGLWAELAAWQRWMVRFMRGRLVRPGRCQQRRPEGRLRRRDGHPRHHRGRRTTSRSRSRASRRSCSGRATAASRCPTTSPAPSTRPSSWRATGPTCRTCTADRLHRSVGGVPGR